MMTPSTNTLLKISNTTAIHTRGSILFSSSPRQCLGLASLNILLSRTEVAGKGKQNAPHSRPIHTCLLFVHSNCSSLHPARMVIYFSWHHAVLCCTIQGLINQRNTTHHLTYTKALLFHRQNNFAKFSFLCGMLPTTKIHILFN
jgi:hypothetical protein